MIVLDTNVLSELMRPEPDARVVTWLGEQPAARVFTTAITQAEILYGISDFEVCGIDVVDPWEG